MKGKALCTLTTWLVRKQGTEATSACRSCETCTRLGVSLTTILCVLAILYLVTCVSYKIKTFRWMINTHLGLISHATLYLVLALQLTQFQTAVIMPRPAVAPDKRRRIARACDSCKRRKERCNGAHPCSICTRRRKEFECNFSDTPARLLRPIHSSPGRLSYKSNRVNCYEISHCKSQFFCSLCCCRHQCIKALCENSQAGCQLTMIQAQLLMMYNTTRVWLKG